MTGASGTVAPTAGTDAITRNAAATTKRKSSPGSSAGARGNDHTVYVHTWKKGTKKTPATNTLLTSYETYSGAATYTVKACNAKGCRPESALSNVVA